MGKAIMRQPITPEILEMAKQMVEGDDHIVSPSAWTERGAQENMPTFSRISATSGDIELEIDRDKKLLNQLCATCLARAIAYTKGATWLSYLPFINLNTRYDRYVVGCYINLEAPYKMSEVDEEILDESARIGRALDKVL